MEIKIKGSDAKIKQLIKELRPRMKVDKLELIEVKKETKVEVKEEKKEVKKVLKNDKFY